MSSAPVPPRQAPFVTRPPRQNNFWHSILTAIQILTFVLVIFLVIKTLSGSDSAQQNATPSPQLPTETPVSTDPPSDTLLPGSIVLKLDKDTFDFGEPIQVSVETSNVDAKTIKLEFIKADGSSLVEKTADLVNQKAEISFEQPFNESYITGKWTVRAQVDGAEGVKDEKSVIIKKPISSIVISPKIDMGDGYVVIPDVSLIKVEVQMINGVELGTKTPPVLMLDNEKVEASDDKISWVLPREKLQADTPGIKILTTSVEYAQVIDESGNAYVDNEMSINLLAQSSISNILNGRPLIKYDFSQNTQPYDDQLVLSSLQSTNSKGTDTKNIAVISLGPDKLNPNYLRVFVLGWVKKAVLDASVDYSLLPVESKLIEPFDVNNVLYPVFPSDLFCVFKNTAGNSVIYVINQNVKDLDFYQIVLFGLLKSE